MDDLERSSLQSFAFNRDSTPSSMGTRDFGLSSEQATRISRRFVQTPSRASSMQSMSPYKRPPIFVEYPNVRRLIRQGDKSKGLRHFSTKVCEKVKEKGTTNYNEVADELVAEYFNSAEIPPGDSQQQYDMKNIRRRVYDALNVLMAMNIIEKEKKEIRWVGLPTSSIQECRKLEQEKMHREDSIRHKSEQLHELIIQLVSYKTLVERNREEERKSGRPTESSILYLPFIVVNTDKQTMVDCAISHDKTEYLFNFNQPFEIHDDIEILKRLGFAHGLEHKAVDPEKREKIKNYLPPILREYIDQICTEQNDDAAAEESTLNVKSITSPMDDKKASYASTLVGRFHSGITALPQTYDDLQLSNQKQTHHQIAQKNATRLDGDHRIMSASGGSVGSHHHQSPNAMSARQFGVQQSGDGHSRSYGRQAAYSIQIPDEEHDERYDEVYDDCEENLAFE